MQKNDNTAVGCFGLWFVFCALLGLGVLGFGGWAAYTLVQWVTTK